VEVPKRLPFGVAGKKCAGLDHYETAPVESRLMEFPVTDLGEPGERIHGRGVITTHHS
jgi:hypothetical protein